MTSEKILVVDDEPPIQKLLEIALENQGYQVLQAENGKTGLAMAASHQPDLILLDIGLPDMSGHAVLQALRQWYNKSIIVLSVQDGEGDIVGALDQGATDYLTKPFRSAELMARIRSALRRNQSPPNQAQILVGDLEIDLANRVVKKNGEAVKLTVTEFQVLALLAKNAGRVLTHQYMLKEIWGIGAQNETQYLRVFIGALRKKIESNPNSPVYLVTESGVGYRFV